MSVDVARADDKRAATPSVKADAVVAGTWIAVAVLGEQAAIALYSPGAWQFGFRSPSGLREHVWALSVILTIAVVGGVAIARLYINTVEPRERRVWAIATIGALWVMTTTLVSRDPASYGVHLCLTAAVHAAGLACIVLAARMLPERFARWGALSGEGSGAWPAVIGAALFATLASATIAWLMFHRVPHVPDEVAYLFQARIYALGRVYLDPPPAPELFRQFLTMVHDGKWFGVFPPGWPLVLSAGVLAGVPWIVNPVLSGIGVVLVYCVVRRVHNSFTAVVAALLVATSPLYVTVGATYMAHALSIVCALVALLSVLELQRGAGIRWAWLGGAALGLLFLARPVEAVSVGVVVLAMCVGALGRRVRASAVVAALATSTVIGSLFFFNNRLLTGSALRDPVQLFFDLTFYPGSNSLGFGPNKGNFGWANDILPGHSPLEAAIHLNLNLSIIDTELFGWLGGALLFVVMLAFGRRERGMWLWIWLVVAVVAPTTLYWYSGADLGPRYWYQTVVPLAALAALGVRVLADGIGVEHRRVAAVAIVLALIGFFQITLWRASDKYQRYRGVSADVGNLIRAHGMEHGLIFVKNGATPNDYADYASGFIWNEIPLGSGPILARYGNASAMAELRAHFPDRRVWVVAPSGTSGAYGVLSSEGSGTTPARP